MCRAGSKKGDEHFRPLQSAAPPAVSLCTTDCPASAQALSASLANNRSEFRVQGRAENDGRAVMLMMAIELGTRPPSQASSGIFWRLHTASDDSEVENKSKPGMMMMKHCGHDNSADNEE